MIRILLVLVACVCAGCTRGRTEPHGAGKARETLSREGFDWRTAEAQGVHLHYLPGGYAAEHASGLARDAAAALLHDRMLADLPRLSEPVEVFLVESRAQARQLSADWRFRRDYLGRR